MREDQRPRSRSYLRYVVLAILGCIIGVITSWLLFPAIFGNGGAVEIAALVIFLIGLLLLARAIWRART